jgi:Domain of unknown function (DUF4411)
VKYQLRRPSHGYSSGRRPIAKYLQCLPMRKRHLWRRSFRYPHFRALITPKQRLVGRPIADPFVIASARVNGATVVSQEAKKPHAARIPNLCEHFGISCVTVEAFLASKRWRF